MKFRMKTRVTILFLLIFLYAPITVWSQWSLFSNPPGGFQYPTGLCVDSNHNFYVNAYVSTSRTEYLYKRDFLSHQWTVLRIDSTDGGPVNASVCLPNGTVVIALDNGIFWTSDAGTSWTTEWTMQHTLSNGNNLAYSPKGILLAAAGTGIYLTDTTDTLWRKTGANLPDSIFSAVFAAPNGYFFASSGTRTYRSTDNGTTWMQPDTVFYHSPMQAFMASKQGMWFAGTFDGLYASTDNGHNWSRINDSLNISRFFQSSDGNIYATTGSQVLRSTNDGTTWEPLTSLWGHNFNAILEIVPGLLAAVDDEGVFESPDRGNHWTPIDSGFSVANVESIVYKDSALYAGLATRGIVRSSDNGKSWQTINDSLTNDSYRLLRTGGQLYAEGTGTVFQWDGHIWHPLQQLGIQTTISTICADTSGKLLAGTSRGIWLFSKDSNTWIPLPAFSGMAVDLLISDSENVLYALVHIFAGGDSPYISKDGGNSWNFLQMPWDATVPYTMAANIDTLSVATSFRLYRTRDHGDTWTTQPLDKYDSIGFNPTGQAFHGGQTFVYNENEIMETEIDNSTWQVDSGYEGVLTSMTVGEDNRAYVGTEGLNLRNFNAPGLGIYSRPLPMSPAGVASPTSTSNTEPLFKIFRTQNHLTITSGQQTISLRIFNVIGDELLSKQGSSTLEADLTPLTTGIYFAVVETNNAREVRRIAIIH